MTHVSSEDKKGVIFSSVLLALSCGVDIFSRKNFILSRFLLFRETLGKNPETPWNHFSIANIR